MKSEKWMHGETAPLHTSIIAYPVQHSEIKCAPPKIRRAGTSDWPCWSLFFLDGKMHRRGQCSYVAMAVLIPGIGEEKESEKGRPIQKSSASEVQFWINCAFGLKRL
jgi:hypothetical protein